MRTLAILEVSQKQSYIFKNKRLQNNVSASWQIRYVTSKEYFQSIASDLFNESNLVYDGGGHTILEFHSKEQAKAFVSRVTSETLKKKEFKGIEIFAKIKEYDSEKTPAENEMELIQQLEEKKSIRAASFHQGKLGIEMMNTRKAEEIKNPGQAVSVLMKSEEDEVLDTSFFQLATEFEALGGSKNESNFIAVIHIDGNLMGKRVAALTASKQKSYPNLTEKSEAGWSQYKQAKDAFSKAIDHDFKAAYQEMLQDVQNAYQKGILEELDLKIVEDQGVPKVTFPVRKIITAGDDICFVTEGRIGIACAVSYLKHIWKKENEMDQKNYSACAGVAIVHQKYPFYKAYELAEALCSNAKRYIATLSPDAAAHVCAIDWHIEFGEMQNGLSDMRRQYRTLDGNQLEMRPYLVCGDEALMEKDPIRTFEHFEAFMKYLKNLDERAARGKWKELRGYLKETEETAYNYLKAASLEETAWKAVDCYAAGNKERMQKTEESIRKQEVNQEQAKILFYPVYEEASSEEKTAAKHNLMFDAIEISDQYLSLEGGKISEH